MCLSVYVTRRMESFALLRTCHVWVVLISSPLNLSTVRMGEGGAAIYVFWLVIRRGYCLGEFQVWISASLLVSQSNKLIGKHVQENTRKVRV